MDSAHACKLFACAMYTAFFTLSSRASGATFTLLNSCPYTVWPGILSNPGWPLLGNGGFVLESGQSTSLSVPPGWAGRFWGRTGCGFSSSGQGTCASGDCGGQYQCKGAGASPPATLAEFTLARSSGSTDFYDLSLVDGYNLPMAIIPRGGSGSCGIASCSSNVNLNCPAELQVVDNDQVVACKSACLAFSSAEYCCEGAYANPSTCKPSLYSQLFKTACPTAYSYAYDDASSTFTCSGTDYTITFCPSSSSDRSVSNLQPGGGFLSTQMAINSGSSVRTSQSSRRDAVISSSISLLSLCVLLFRFNL